MRMLNVAPIVEGDGEVSSVPILLRRIATRLMQDCHINVLRPIRQPRQKLITNKDDCLSKSIDLAASKLSQHAIPQTDNLILVLVDADDDCAARQGPTLLALAQSLRSDVDISFVLAVPEYETWFAAAAESLDQFLRIDDPSRLPSAPETQRCRKKWVSSRFRGAKYSETVDQPKLTAHMDLADCRARSPSFDKLCRELESRLLRKNAHA